MIILIKIAPIENTKMPPTVFPTKNTKPPHQNQHLCFRGIFVFSRDVF